MREANDDGKKTTNKPNYYLNQMLNSTNRSKWSELEYFTFQNRKIYIIYNCLTCVCSDFFAKFFGDARLCTLQRIYITSREKSIRSQNRNKNWRCNRFSTLLFYTFYLLRSFKMHAFCTEIDDKRNVFCAYFFLFVS